MNLIFPLRAAAPRAAHARNNPDAVFSLNRRGNRHIPFSRHQGVFIMKHFSTRIVSPSLFPSEASRRPEHSRAVPEFYAY